MTLELNSDPTSWEADKELDSTLSRAIWEELKVIPALRYELKFTLIPYLYDWMSYKT